MTPSNQLLAAGCLHKSAWAGAALKGIASMLGFGAAGMGLDAIKGDPNDTSLFYDPARQKAQAAQTQPGANPAFMNSLFQNNATGKPVAPVQFPSMPYSGGEPAHY